MSKSSRIAFLAVVLSMAACGAASDSLSEPVSETVPAEPFALAPEPPTSIGETWAVSGIRGVLGTRDTEFVSQMPDGNEVTTAWSQSGVNRIHTMTWSEGSQVVTYRRPSVTPGEGLQLYTIYRIGFP